MSSARHDEARAKPPGIPGEIARLHALERYRTLSARDVEGLSRLSREAALNLGATRAVISIVDDARVWFGGAFGFEAESVAREGSFCDAVVRSGKPLVVANAKLDPRFWDHALVRTSPGVRSYAGVPLVDGAGYILGTVAIHSEASGRFSPAILPNLLGVAALVRDFLAEACQPALSPAQPPVQGWFGVRVLIAQPGDPVDAGLVILSVKRGGPADQAGLRATDVVHSIGGYELREPADVVAALAERAPGSRVRVRFRRGWDWQECDLEIRARRRLFRPW